MQHLIPAILNENLPLVKKILLHDVNVNELDPYGFTPLIEAAIVDSHDISKLLLENNADPNFKDAVGNTPLHWAVENNNVELAKTLLKNGANPNEYNFAGQPILVIPTLRQYKTIRDLLLDHGADPNFSLDYINTKFLGHLFELTGFSSIITPKHQFIEVDFEGYFLETTIGLIANSLLDFKNHFAFRRLKKQKPITEKIIKTLLNGLELIKLQQYRVKLEKHQDQIHHLLHQEPILIPVGYEGHAITFIKYKDIWIKCDRREDSRLYDNIMFYHIGNKTISFENLIKKMIYEKQSHEFINIELDRLLKLEPITELKIEAQLSGNCSWANVEASIPSLFFLFLELDQENDFKTTKNKNAAIHYFHQWREWAKDKALEQCYYYFNQSDSIRKATKAEILTAILFHRMDDYEHDLLNKKRIDEILELLIDNNFKHLLYNYMNVYYFKIQTELGKKFAGLLKEKGIKLERLGK